MENKGKYYITTAIAYSSGKPHIGNCYEIILGDSIARFKRADGYDVRFMTGTDEHGQKIEQRATEAGQTPKEFVDGVYSEIKGLWDLMGTSYDRFIRTTDADHERQVQKMFKKFYDQGDIYKSEYHGKYCTSCEAYYTESQLVDGRCPTCGGPVHDEHEESYFFKMSKYAPQLIEYINTHPEFIQPESRKNEMLNNFLLPGLQDLCVSRSSFSWGIPVEFAPGHVVYVWLDALSNYITGVEYDVDGSNGPLYRYWPADLHLIGKDIVRFHTIYWPIFLMALGQPLPRQVFGHPWLLQGGEKMSKSKGNVIYVDDMIDIFGLDAVRYFCLHEMPYENDGVITWELVVERTNTDLANTLGNLVNRTIAMSNKYFGGLVENKGVEGEPDADMKRVVTGAYDLVEEKMKDLRVADAMTAIFNVFKRLNKYIDETEPWVLAKDEAQKDRLATVLYNLIEGITIGGSLLAPFLPTTADKIMEQLHTSLRPFDEMKNFGAYPSGNHVTETPEILFARLDQKEVMEKVAVIMEKQKAAAAKAAARADVSAAQIQAAAEGQEEELPGKPEISIEDFDKLELKIGEVIRCEAVPKSKKLLCSQIRIGKEVRQIVSGIHKFYEPEQMVGKKVVVITNLKPVKLAGVESNGMVLCAEDEAGNLSVISPEAEKNIMSGSTVH